MATVSAVAIMLFAGCTAAVGEPAADENDELASACVPQVPPALAVPQGNKLAFSYDAIGVIPWLLLGATGHAGKGRMTDVTFIHRLETAGGKAPATGCDATHIGETVRVDYTATYYFYEARGKK